MQASRSSVRAACRASTPAADGAAATRGDGDGMGATVVAGLSGAAEPVAGGEGDVVGATGAGDPGGGTALA